MSELIIDKIRDYLEEMLADMGLELFDIQFRREGHGWVLRVFIDSGSGITLDHCSDVSRELSQFLDVEDLIEHQYNLEVSSPGLERPLRSIEDFNRFTGKKAKARLHQPLDGEKIMVGVIEKIDDQTIFLKREDDSRVQFTFEMLNKARLVLD